ncbi:MAG: ATP-dependent helicase [Synechococcales cyanobacterium C42_A2020_086]|nr:ATP-dependent helicase [Synechococcales cyanobacterium C42_A2020_086]
MSISSSQPVLLPQEIAIQTLRQSLRPGQQQMADWQTGTLAVSAVPGSGKSTGMAIAAAILLAKRYVRIVESFGSPSSLDAIDLFAHAPGASGQLLLVTFTRSAVANLRGKIRQLLQEFSIPAQGFLVYTLHGLALHIASRHPQLSGLDLERLTLISPNQSNRLIRASVEQWIRDYPDLYRQLLEGRQFDGEETERLRRQSVLRTEVLPDLAYTAIHEAKSSGLMPEDLRRLSQSESSRVASHLPDYSVLTIAAGLYERYQAQLRMRQFLDYDDMILAALRVLDDPAARQFWQSQIYAVFEDEAQDSSPLQTRLLELLAAHPTDARQPLNLVRVGDPNQAINSTFTPADPAFFNAFCQQCQAEGRLATIEHAGRSSPIIMAAANFVLDWVNGQLGQQEPRQSSRESTRTAQDLPFRPQHILPVPPGDPQEGANPPPIGTGLEIRFPPDTVQTVNLIGRRVADLFAQEPEARAAVLVRENRQGRFITQLLRQPEQYGIEVNLSALGIDLYDVGEHDRHSHVPAEMLTLLQFVDRPHSPDFLKAALQLLVDRQRIPTQDLNRLVSLPEQFLYPGPLDPPQPEPILQARRYCVGLLRARLELPLYQLISFLALTLQYDQAELATADKLAERITRQGMGRLSLSSMIDALSEIVQSERFEAIEPDEPDSRYLRPGQLTIITMHKAKGLDWDFVFIPFLHEQMIPGNLRVLPQTQFLGDYTLADVARAQLRASLHGEFPIPDTAAAWERAKALKTAEEYRLLYVAMTRARRLLWMSAAQKAPFTWSKPESLDHRVPCPVLPALCQQFPQALRP